MWLLCVANISLLFVFFSVEFQSKNLKSQTISEKKNMIRVYLGFCFNLKHILISFQDIN